MIWVSITFILFLATLVLGISFFIEYKKNKYNDVYKNYQIYGIISIIVSAIGTRESFLWTSTKMDSIVRRVKWKVQNTPGGLL